MLKKSHSFYEPQLTQHCKNYILVNKVKNFTHFTNFPANMAIVGVRKSICTALNVRLLLYISLRKCCSREVESFYLVGNWIISLRRPALWISYNVLKFFILIEIFGISAIFHHFDTSINSIETLKFLRQFELQRWLNFS